MQWPQPRNPTRAPLSRVCSGSVSSGTACAPRSPGRSASAATDLDALEHLEADGPLTQRELGERLSLTSGAITMLVDRLEAAGWVRRGPHPSDRRFVLLELSGQAHDHTPAGLARFHDRIRSVAANVPAAHREAIRDFLVAAAEAASTAATELRG